MLYKIIIYGRTGTGGKWEKKNEEKRTGTALYQSSRRKLLSGIRLAVYPLTQYPPLITGYLLPAFPAETYSEAFELQHVRHVYDTCPFVCFSADAGLTEEEVLLEKAASQDKDAEMAMQRATLVLRLREGINSLARVLKVIEVRFEINIRNNYILLKLIACRTEKETSYTWNQDRRRNRAFNSTFWPKWT